MEFDLCCIERGRSSVVVPRWIPVDVDCVAGVADLIGSGCANDAAIAEFTRLRLMN